MMTAASPSRARKCGGWVDLHNNNKIKGIVLRENHLTSLPSAMGVVVDNPPCPRRPGRNAKRKKQTNRYLAELKQAFRDEYSLVGAAKVR